MPRYIDADAFIALYKEMAKDDWNKRAAPISWSHAFENIIDDVEEMPTADVQPVRHGRWIVTGAAQYFLAKCSVCGRIEDRRRINGYPYCHCGAKMDGGDE